MEIFLVRHGEASASWGEDPDPGLSTLGEQQASTCAKILLPQLNSTIKLLSSPLKRAQETAYPLAQALGAPIAIVDAYREIPAPVPLGDRKNWLQGFMQEDWGSQPEELLKWREEMLGQLRKLQSPTIIFTHFLVINTVVGYILGRQKTLHVWPDNGSITQLSLKGDSLSLVKLGDQLSTVVN